MAVISGIVDPDGVIVRKKGDFKVASKTTTLLEVDFKGLNVSKAFLTATPWRGDSDIGPAALATSPRPGKVTRLLFAIDAYYGVSFRVET